MPVFNNALAGAAGSGGAAEFKIERSLRFNSGDSAYLDKDFSSSGNRKTWTWSGWVKRSKLGTEQVLWTAGANTNTGEWSALRFTTTDQLQFVNNTSNSTDINLLTTQVFRDVSAWYHILLRADISNATANDRIDIYINGTKVDAYSTQTQPGTTVNTGINGAQIHNIGREAARAGYYCDLYLAEVHFVDGQALAPTDFGEPDATTGVWNPIAFAGSHGSNGFHLNFSDTSALGNDAAGSNHWTPYNLVDTSKVWSELTTSSNTNFQFPFKRGFDGVITGDGGTAGFAGWTANSVTLTFSNLSASSNVVVYAGSGLDSSISATCNIGGTNYTQSASSGYVNTLTFNNTGAVTTLALTSGGGGVRFYGIKVDGTTLVDIFPSDIDSLIDSPQSYEADSGNNGGNYATYNPLNLHNTADTVSQGNLKLTSSGSGSSHMGRGTIAMKSGKWYFEVTWVDTQHNFVGIVGQNDTGYNNSYLYLSNAKKSNNNGSSEGSSYGATWGNGDIIGCAFDADNGTLAFYKNGVPQGTAFTGIATDGSAGTYSPYPRGYVAITGNWNYNACTSHINFGQRPFAISSVPTGYKSLCTQNLDPPTIADGSTAMDVVTWTGNGNSTRTISNYSFSPDFVWIKNRTTSGWQHVLYDQIRGEGTSSVTKSLSTDSTRTEASGNDTTHGYLSGFTSDGFSLVKGSQSGGDYVNHLNWEYVGWAWDTGSSNTSISAGSLNSSVYDTRTLWRNAVSGTAEWNSAASLFNNSDTGTHAYSGNSQTFTTPSGYPLSGTLEVHMSRGSGASAAYGTYDVKVNGTSVFDHNKFPYNTNAIVNLGTFTNITSIEWGYGGNNSNDWIALHDIRVNGKELVDSDVTPLNVPSIPSNVRANQSAGFSIVTYEADAPNNVIGHGLNAEPYFVITKARDRDDNWLVYHHDLGVNKWLHLNLPAAETSTSGIWGTASNWTTSTFGVSTSSIEGNNYGSHDFVAYCWAPVEGYSSFGKYSGNGSDDGPFVYTGFRPRWIMTKAYSSNSHNNNNWIIIDTARDLVNEADQALSPNTTANTLENAHTGIDILSNGFKLKGDTNGQSNYSGWDYIYAAFAEHPQKTARAR